MSYEQKYLKYKEKYLNLKKQLENNNTQLDIMDVEALSDTPVSLNMVGGSAPIDVYKPCTTFPCGNQLNAPGSASDDSALASVSIQKTRSIPREKLNYNLNFNAKPIDDPLPVTAAFKDMASGLSVAGRTDDKIYWDNLTPEQAKNFNKAHSPFHGSSTEGGKREQHKDFTGKIGQRISELKQMMYML